MLDILQSQGREVTAFVDDHSAELGGSIHGVPVYPAANVLNNWPMSSEWVVAIGDNAVRQRLAKKLATRGCRFTMAVHPSAQIGLGVKIAPGTVIMANAVINADTQIGHHVIINTGAIIDHDCCVGDYCHVAPGCSVCGNVTLGSCVMLGVGSCICPGITIGDETCCGAGSVIVKSLPARCVAYGCPAKIVRSQAG
ncbi:MAG: acetyltransferase [Cyanobacteria bacterium P01_F01_bin.56]